MHRLFLASDADFCNIKTTAMQFHALISFDGNCREAFEHYKSVFGGTVHLDELPEALQSELPERLARSVVWGSFRCEHFEIFGSDLSETTVGGRVTLLVRDPNGERLSQLIRKLMSESGPNPDFTQNQTVSATDKFGVQWLFWKHA